MITGKKRRRTNEPGGDARRASFAALLIAGLAGLVMTGLLISASASAGGDIRNRNYEDAYHEDRDERGRDH
jgi:hypothetical protein